MKNRQDTKKDNDALWEDWKRILWFSFFRKTEREEQISIKPKENLCSLVSIGMTVMDCAVLEKYIDIDP